MRQCSWCSACPSHSSPHTLQAWVQACKVAFAISTSKAVWRERTLPVASHMSAQSRSRRMQRISICTSCSPRQASAQAVQAWAQSKQASMHSTSASASTAGSLGFVSIIRRAWVMLWLLSFVTSGSGGRLTPRVPLLEPTPHLLDLPRLIFYDAPGEVLYCGVGTLRQGHLGHFDGRLVMRDHRVYERLVEGTLVGELGRVLHPHHLHLLGAHLHRDLRAAELLLLYRTQLFYLGLLGSDDVLGELQ